MRLSPKRLVRYGLAALGLAALAAPTARAEDLFVSSNSGIISRYAGTGPGTFSTTATTLTDPSLTNPQGLAFDSRGDLFAVNYSNTGGTITEFPAGITPGTFAQATTFAVPGLRGAEGLALDASGDLFVANDTYDRLVTEIFAGTTPGTFGQTTTLTDPSLNVPVGLAFDAPGALFVSNSYGNSITKFAAGATPGTFGATSTLTGGLNFPQGLAFDSRGNLFAANGSGGTITEFAFNSATGTFSAGQVIKTIHTNAVSLAFDAQGDLFVVDFGGTITEFAFNFATGTFGAAQTVEQGPTSSTFLAFGPSVSPVLVSLTFPSPVPGGTVVTATVTLSGPAQADTAVGTSSSDPSVVRINRGVIVPAGASSATFAINTFRSHTTQSVTVSASLAGVVKSVPLTITGR